MRYDLLTQRHPDYDERTWAELDLLYEGGIRAMRAAESFIKPLDGEKPSRYADRLRLVAYVPYPGQIIDYFTSGLFQSGLDVTEAVDADDPATAGEGAQQEDFWDEFAKDADRKGTPFSGVIREAVRTALLKKKALVALDFPDPGKKPENRLEEKALGADRGYAYNLPVEELVDWELDDQGRFEWCVLYEKIVERPSPKASRSLETHRWTVWTRGEAPDVDQNDLAAFEAAKEAGDLQAASRVLRTLQKRATPAPDAKARWERYEFTCPIGWDAFSPDTEIPLVDSGETSFPEIPILLLELPAGLWAGNLLGPMAVEHWSRRSALVGAEARNMTAVTFAELGKDDGGLGADALDGATKRALREKGVDIALPGRLGVAEPQAHAYEVVQRDLKDLKDEMFRVAHQMAMSVDNSSSSTRRSGESKKQDKTDVDVVLGALAVFAKVLAVRVYRVLAAAMKEADVLWTARGLDKFTAEDRTELTQEGMSLGIVLDSIPSPTFRKEALTQFAFRWAPNLDPTTQDTIRKEIADGVDSHQELEDKLLENEKDAADDPAPTPGDAHDDAQKVALEAAKNPAPGAPPGAGAPPGKNGAGAKPAPKPAAKDKGA